MSDTERIVYYTKLKSGAWGVRVKGDGHKDLKAGDEVTVTTKKGEKKQERIANRVATFDDGSLYGIDKDWF